MPNSLKSRMNESLMYGSEEQPGWRHPGLSSTIYAWGETPSWAVGKGSSPGETPGVYEPRSSLPSNGDSLNQESPSTAT